MSVITPKYRYPILKNNETPYRKPNNAFYLSINDHNKIRVCKSFFISTLGITDRSIRTVLAKTTAGFLQEDRRGKRKKCEVSLQIKNYVRAHIAQIPAVESHNIWAHSEKKYIDGGKTIAGLHRDYKADSGKEGKPYANLTMYSKIFNNEFNLSFFTSKKDECDKCAAYRNANDEERTIILQKEYDEHHEEKELSRLEKTNDRNKTSSSFKVACFDLQQVMRSKWGGFIILL